MNWLVQTHQQSRRWTGERLNCDAVRLGSRTSPFTNDSHDVTPEEIRVHININIFVSY